MPNREDETYLNLNPHPPTCKCPQCIKESKKRRYPYPASIECPACGHFSLYYSNEKAKYRCMNEQCQAEGQTLKEIRDRKAQLDEQLKNLWEQLK